MRLSKSETGVSFWEVSKRPIWQSGGQVDALLSQYAMLAWLAALAYRQQHPIFDNAGCPDTGTTNP
jgi:hypothetical protein